MLFDSHVHTVHSCDADTTLDDSIRAAHEKNIGLIITDHMDHDFPTPPPDFRLDTDLFFQECAPHRCERLLLGVELGMTENSLAFNRQFAAAHPFDFVLGSVHVLHGREVDETLYADMDEARVYREYLTACAKLIREADIDAFAHMDYPLRTTDRELPYADYRAYKARGGRYVTLGSDAHEPQEIADNFALAEAFLRETELIPVHFRQRQMVIDQP